MNRFVFIALVLSICLCTIEHAAETTVRTLNIRHENRGDPSELKWQDRKNFVASMIHQEHHDSLGQQVSAQRSADLISLQEVKQRQLRDLVHLLGESYEFVGEGRDGGTRGEYNPILIRKQRYDLLHSDTRWLAPGTPNRPKKAFGTKLRRIVTYAYLHDKVTGSRVWIFNTHLSHTGYRVSVQQADVLFALIKNLSRTYQPTRVTYRNGKEVVLQDRQLVPFSEPVIVTGDFNATLDSVVAREMLATPRSEPIGMLMEESNWSKKLNFPQWSDPIGDPRLVAKIAGCGSRIQCPILREFGRLWSALGGLWTHDSASPRAPREDSGTVEASSSNMIDWILHSAEFAPAETRITRYDVNRDMWLSDVHDMLTVTFDQSRSQQESKPTSFSIESTNCCEYKVNRVDLH